jgi:photosystem II stability/assembly factor-like uncharacterized protein
MGFIINSRLNAIDTRSPGHYVAVGKGATLIYSDDGGSHWKLGQKELWLTSPISINGVWMWDDHYGYACSDDGFLIRTTDGGANWQFLPKNPLFVPLKGIAYHKGDTITGLAVGDDRTILRTVDGGKNWVDASNKSIVKGSWVTFNSVTFADANTAYLVGDSGMIAKSTDKGLNWKKQTSPVKADLLSLYFLNKDNGFASGRNGTIIQTSDGGTNWKSIHATTADTNTFSSISFCDALHGMAGKFLTTDGGKTWDTVPVRILGKVRCSHIISPTHYVIGSTVYDTLRFPVGAEILTVNGDSIYRNKISPGYNYGTEFNCIDFADSLRGTLVGEYNFSQVVKAITSQTSDGGKTWQDQTNTVGRPLYCVTMPRKDIASSCGWRGRIIRRVNTMPVESAPEHSASTNSSFSISAAYPNPARENTTLLINITRSMPLELRLYDLKGDELKSFDLGMQSVGHFEAPLSLSGLADGTYIVELRSPSQSRHIQIKVIH